MKLKEYSFEILWKSIFIDGFVILANADISFKIPLNNLHIILNEHKEIPQLIL